MGESTFEVADAVALGYCTVDRVGRDRGLRVLAIKGPVPAAHGLLAARPSIDVDVLVAPSDVDQLCAELGALGWYSVDGDPGARLFAYHSVTLAHEAWPVTIDLHFQFPGFLADPDDVFEALWAERAEIPVAGVSVVATGLCGSTLISSLHALRDPHRPTSVGDLAQVGDRWAQMADQYPALSELAVNTGALQTAGPLFMRLGIAVPRVDDEFAGLLADWQVRGQVSGVRGLVWVRALQDAPWHRRPLVVWRALVTPDVSALRTYGMAADGAGRVRAHLRRIRRLLGDLVPMLRVAVRHRVGIARLERKR